MESGCKILWTDHALKELDKIYDYLKTHFTEREMKKLSIEVDKTLKLISINPSLFPKSEFKGIRRIIIKKFNTMYYREKENTVEILSFFSNRQNLDKRKV
jgi:plasmid stabilization system protein ParE